MISLFWEWAPQIVLIAGAGLAAALLFKIGMWREAVIVGILASVYGYHVNEVRKARNEGFAQCEAKGIEDAKKRVKNALEAERRILFGNDADGLRDDGFRRKDQ